MELFQDVDGMPVPQLPWDDRGSTLTADGVRFFDLAQAAARFGRAETWLRNFYRATFRAVLGNESEILQTPGESSSNEPAAPAAASESSPARSIRAQARLRWLALKYPSIDVDYLELFVAQCDERGLNALCGDLIPRIERDEKGKMELKIITTVAALRKIAARSGMVGGEDDEQFAGPDGVWRDGWEGEAPPSMARVVVYRRDSERPFSGIAYWDECAQFTEDARGNKVLDKFYAMMPRTMLAKCAAARALRKAYPDDLTGLYIYEEMRPLAGSGQSMRLTPSQPAGEIDARPLDEAEAAGVTSNGQWEMALFDLGLRDPATRRLVMARLRSDFQRFGDETHAFYSMTLRAVKDDPRRYGVSGAA